MGEAAVVNLILGLIDRAASLGSLLAKAKSENRDVLSSEIDALVSADDQQKLISDAANKAARVS